MVVRRQVGIVVVPEYFDTTSKELTSMSPDIDVLHTQIRVDADFDFSLDQIRETADEIERCAASLARAGAEVVLQLGTPFSSAHGWDAGNDLQSHIEATIGVPFEMMGLSVPAGMLATGAKKVALATTYYNPEWVDRCTRFATEAGLSVIASESFVDQGLFDSPEESWAASFAGFDSATIVDSITSVWRHHPEAEGILVPGMPGRFLDHVAELEHTIERPVVSYFAIWWRCLSRLGLKVDGDYGTLLTNTENIPANILGQPT